MDTVKLFAGATYVVKIKSFADTALYGELPIAALMEDEFYTDPFTMILCMSLQ